MKFIQEPNYMGSKPIQTAIWAVVKNRINSYDMGNEIENLKDVVGRLIQVLADKDILNDKDIRKLLCLGGPEENIEIVDLNI